MRLKVVFLTLQLVLISIGFGGCRASCPVGAVGTGEVCTHEDEMLGGDAPNIGSTAAPGVALEEAGGPGLGVNSAAIGSSNSGAAGAPMFASPQSETPTATDTRNAAPDDPFTAARTQWWRDGRFGMFIHFGPYSHLQGEYRRADGTTCLNAEWIQRECQIPRVDYERIAREFNPELFDAEAIAQTALEAGQKYIVITAKHHDGYAMWPTKVNTWNLRDHSKFDKARDILYELKQSAAKRGLKFGLYYSIWDWHDEDFPDAQTFPRYEQRMYSQLKELVDRYDPSVLWFDGEWATDRPNNPWSVESGDKLEEYVRSLKPTLLVNNRVGKRRVVDGDFGTPEQEIPARPIVGQLWETCMTLNGSWGFVTWDTNWKPARELVRSLLSITSRGGNYLLNIGPDKDGRIPAASLERLREMGRWLDVNSLAIHAHEPGIVAEPSWGAVSRHGQKLYVSVFDWPDQGASLSLSRLAPFEVLSSRVLGGSSQSVSCAVNGDTLELRPSGLPANDFATVVELEIRTADPAGNASGTGLLAEFWPNADFAGQPSVSRVDRTINYDWNLSGSPSPALSAPAFASRWTGSVEAPYTEEYTFSTVSDDTVRLWIDDKMVIDNVQPHGPVIDSAVVALSTERRHSIRLEHTQRGGEASIKLSWSSPRIPQQIVPAERLYSH